MADRIKWDVDKMAQIHKEIADKLNELEQNRSFLADIDKIAEQAWQGTASGVYNLKLDMDMRIYDLMLKELRELNDDLGKAVNNCYRQCEEELRREMVSLGNYIR